MSELELVLRMMLESMTESEVKRIPGSSLFPMRVSEMETNWHEEMLKLGPRSVSVLKQSLEWLVELGLVPEFELMMEPTKESGLEPVKKLKLKKFLV